MEPAFQRGDLLFLWNRNLLRETEVGEVVVYNVKDKDIPIVHRIVRKFGGGYVMLRNGDRRRDADLELQRHGQASDQGRQQLVGRHRAIRQRTGLPGAEGYYRQCFCIHTICWIRNDPAVGAPMAQDCHAGDHGSFGCFTEGIVCMRERALSMAIFISVHTVIKERCDDNTRD